MKTLRDAPDTLVAFGGPTEKRRWLPALLLVGTLAAVVASRDSAPARPAEAAEPATAVEAPELHFPAVQGQSQASAVHIQGLGGVPTGVMLVVFKGGQTTWSKADPPAPIDVLCRKGSPGAALEFTADQLPPIEVSAVAFSLRTDRSAAGGPFDQPPYDIACRNGQAMVGDAAAYLAFKRSFEDDGAWLGYPWRMGWGNPLSGFVRQATTGHNQVQSHGFVAGSPARPRPDSPLVRPLADAPLQAITGTVASYGIPLMAKTGSAINGEVTVQNAGNGPLRVQVWQQGPDGIRAALCDGSHSLDLPVAATQHLCLEPLSADATLLVQAAGTQPRLAIGVAMEPDRSGVAAGYDADLAAGSRLALPMPFPLVEDDSALVQLVNPSSSDALVEVSWQDGKGSEVIRRRQSLKPWESATLDLGGSPVPLLPTQGFVLVRSLGGSAGSAAGDGPAVSAVLLLRRLTMTAPRSFDMTQLVAEPFRVIGSDAAAERGGLIAVPLLQDTAEGISELSLLDTAEGDGFTDLRLAVMDANGLLDVDCMRVDHGRVLVWDLRNLRTLPTGFRGSGIVSAEYWEHARPAPAGAVAGADLVASLAMRSRNGERPVEAAAESLARYPASAIQDPILPLLPPCPGVPTRVPPASATPSATSTPSPSATPSATATPRVTPTWTASPSPSPSPTPSRPRLFLPAVLAGVDPWPLGLVLVVDVLAGSPVERSDPAAIPLPAARRLGLTALDLLRPREDSAALVQFDAAAQVLSMGRAAHVAAALRALAEVDLTATARPDLGLAAADLALRDLRGSAGAQRGAVLLFVDGKTEPEAFEKAVIRAGRLRSGGVAVFALGFGDRGGGPASALERIAGSSQNLHWVGDGEAGLVQASDALERWAASGWQRLGAAAPVGSGGAAR